MRLRKLNAVLALVLVALAIVWTVAGCAVVLPGGRPDGLPARVAFPVRGADPLAVPVTPPVHDGVRPGPVAIEPPQ